MYQRQISVSVNLGYGDVTSESKSPGGLNRTQGLFGAVGSGATRVNVPGARVDLMHAAAGPNYLGDVPRAIRWRYISFMSPKASPAQYRCMQCEQPETSCQCEKYCCLCQSVIDIRICDDGLMYCEPCRKACDYKTSE